MIIELQSVLYKKKSAQIDVAHTDWLKNDNIYFFNYIST